MEIQIEDLKTIKAELVNANMRISTSLDPNVILSSKKEVEELNKMLKTCFLKQKMGEERYNRLYSKQTDKEENNNNIGGRLL